jgi:hypothetical protein
MNMKSLAAAENNRHFRVVLPYDFAQMQGQASAHFQAVWTNVPVVVNLVLVSEGHKITVNVNNVLAVKRNAVALYFFATLSGNSHFRTEK